MSLRNRFNVFKRDGFKCKYCGRGVPDVVLEVDHITPVSKGGDNSSNNLITSCFDCNRGKADGLLEDIPDAIETTLEQQIILRKEKKKQIARFDKELRKLKEQEQVVYDELGIFWWDHFVDDDEKGQTVFANKRLGSIKLFVKHLTPGQIKESMDIALNRIVESWYRRTDEEFAWKYFCGICWNIIKGRQRV